MGGKRKRRNHSKKKKMMEMRGILKKAKKAVAEVDFLIRLKALYPIVLN